MSTLKNEPFSVEIDVTDIENSIIGRLAAAEALREASSADTSEAIVRAHSPVLPAQYGRQLLRPARGRAVDTLVSRLSAWADAEVSGTALKLSFDGGSIDGRTGGRTPIENQRPYIERKVRAALTAAIEAEVAAMALMPDASLARERADDALDTLLAAFVLL